ncbi:MAG: hypothetical protein M3Z22_08260, partial [Verrucomicrobiota bacterium]|nr:hypothetical protein [Verrucomicrobiota bacterium]
MLTRSCVALQNWSAIPVAAGVSVAADAICGAQTEESILSSRQKTADRLRPNGVLGYNPVIARRKKISTAMATSTS